MQLLSIALLMLVAKHSMFKQPKLAVVVISSADFSVTVNFLSLGLKFSLTFEFKKTQL